MEKPTRDKGIDTDKMSSEQLAKLSKIRRDLLLMFEQSIGWQFRIKGTPLVDEVTGVDWQHEHVKGKQYGNFHVDLCEISNEQTSLTN